MPYCRAGRIREALPMSWEASGEPREMGRDGRGWEALLEGWEESGGPLGEPGMGGVSSPLRRAERIRRPSWRDGMGRERWERSVFPPVGMGMVGSPPRRDGKFGRLVERQEG